MIIKKNFKLYLVKKKILDVSDCGVLPCAADAVHMYLRGARDAAKRIGKREGKKIR